MNARSTWALAALAMLPGALLAAAEIHVAPGGHDSNPGTIGQPVATPQGAQALVRNLTTAGLSDSVEVVFSGGTYFMDGPLELRPEDSGTAAFPIRWRASAGATVILSGGKPITAAWTDGGNGIWHVDLAGIGLGVNDWNFRQLMVEGRRTPRARFPNADEANPFLYATGGGLGHAIIDPVLLKASWGSAADSQLNIVPQWKFFNQWNTVTGVDPVTGRIDYADSERHGSVTSGNWFWIEGVQEELDQPGEWFLDPLLGRLHYMPEPGVDPHTLTMVAPFLNRIVNAQGDVDAGTHVEHVHFEGLDFRHTTFSLGHIEARVHTDTAVMFENTNDSSVTNCHFENIGGYALWLHLDSQRNVFDHNTVLHSGAGGVLVTGSRLGYMDDSKVYTPGEAASKVAPILNEITHNTVEHCGEIRYYGGGVHLDSRPFSMSMAPGNYIAHNHFNDLSRNGIFAFRNQGGNVIEYNHIHNAMQTTIDGACIHFATMNRLNAPNYILNNWLYDIWGYEQRPDGTPVRHLANGIFLDWDSSNTTVVDNWIYNAGGAAVKVIFGGNWNVVTARNQSSSTVITPPFVAELGPGGTATNAIDLATNKLTGSIIHYTDASHFGTSGTWTPESRVGLAGLFVFNYLVGTAAVPSEAVYTLPITEDGSYQIALLYEPDSDRASNAPIAIEHADGTANLSWNMQQGSAHGFAVALGTYRFEAAQANTVTLSTTGVNGKVIADAVAFVKIADNVAPLASNVQQAGVAEVGSVLTGSYDYLDADNDLQGASRFQWYRSEDPAFDAGDSAIANATSRSYRLEAGDSGKYLFFEVTPFALTGITSGAPVQSAASMQVAPNDPPTAGGVSISGTAEVGTLLTGSYTFSDADGDSEGASLVRWYRSDDAVLDAGDTVVAGVVEVTPAVVKTSTALSAQRLAINLFNANGMNTSSGQELLNLDGSQAGEPTSADGVSWVTPSGSEGALLADRKVWFVADLGASHALHQVRIWNFQWDHITGDLSNRGMSQFDCYVRDSAADTDDGAAGGTAINVDGSAAMFRLGTSNPWRPALVDQVLARAPNADNYTGESVSLAAERARFLAIVAGSYFGGNGIGLGKVRVQVGQGMVDYTPVTADAGKYLFFEVTPVAVGGDPIGSAVASAGILVPGAPPVSIVTLIAEDFDGAGGALNATSADTFAPAIIAAGGTGSWIAGGAFLDDGTVSVDAAQNSASLDLGSYLNDAAGSADGKFELTLTISETVGEWISLGFSSSNTPSTTANFTAASGIATIIRREIGDWDLDLFAGPGNAGGYPGPEPSGARTLTVTLDLTPDGGYDGTSNFGTVTWSDSLLGELGNHPFSSSRSFGSILISEANSSGGTIDNLTLAQLVSVPPPLTYDVFAATIDWQGADSSAGGDADGNGFSNLYEYATGTDPMVAGEFYRVSYLVYEEGGQSYFEFTYREATEAIDLVFTLSESPDLVQWTPASPGPGDVVVAPIPNRNLNDVSVRFPVTPGKRFYRLSIEQVGP